MTTAHHTPLPYLGALTSAQMESPLGELDSAIEDIIAGGTVAAASSVLSGTALVGQPDLAVTSATGFTAGQTVYIGHASGSYETGVIDTVVSNTITLTDDLANTYAAGTPVTVSPVEVVVARGDFETLGARMSRATPYTPNAVGDNVVDDTAAIQAMIDEALATNGHVRIPATATGYKISSTLIIDGALAPTAGQAHIKIESSGGNATLNWAGADNTPVFHTYGIRKSAIHGIAINIPATSTGVIGWEVDTKASAASTSRVSWYDCSVLIASGATDIIGWRLGHGRAADDISFLGWYNCAVTADVRNGHIGWVNESGNGLDHYWFGGSGYYLDKLYTNLPTSGAAALVGNSSCFFYGLGTSHNDVEFEIASGGTVGIFGGRFETGTTFMKASSASVSPVIVVSGCEISNFTGPVVSVSRPANMLMTSCNLNMSSDLGTGLITLGATTGTRPAHFTIRNCNIMGSAPFYTATAEWSVRVENVLLTNTSLQPTSRAPDQASTTTVELTFTETSGDGTYTGTVAVPAGATVTDVVFRNTALWTASTSASLTVGDDDDADGYIQATDIKAAPSADTNGAGQGISTRLSLGATAGAYKGGAGKYCAAAKTITATITKVGTGTAGRSRLLVTYTAPPTSVVSKV